MEIGQLNVIKGYREAGWDRTADNGLYRKSFIGKLGEIPG
jgi:hypothetical protein